MWSGTPLNGVKRPAETISLPRSRSHLRPTLLWMWRRTGTDSIRIECCSQRIDKGRKRIFKVAVLTLTEPVPSHVDVASEVVLAAIERRDDTAFLGRDKR